MKMVYYSRKSGNHYPMQRQANKDLSHYLKIGIATSLLLHLLLMYFLTQRTQQPLPQPMMVDFVSEQSIQPKNRQIVSQPEVKTESLPMAESNLLSERDISVKKEQIQRGTAPDAAEVQGAQPKQASAPAEKSAPLEQTQQPKNLEAEEPAATENTKAKPSELKLSDAGLLEKFAKANKDRSEKKSEDSQAAPLSDYRAFSRPQGSGAAVLGTRGSNDYLPNLPDGDITFLNTKAEHFAVFVRRVATQVFSQLRVEGWEELSAHDINQIGTFNSVRAVLSPRGDLISVKLEFPSGSNRFDEILLRAVRKAAKDRNPPVEAAANDGNIHFIFKARSWSRFVSGGRSGMPTEQRWLLMGTGLE